MRRFFSKALWLFVHRIPWKPILIWGPWVLVLLVLAFYGVENWRGDRAYRKAIALAEGLGYSLAWEDYVPREIPAEENFANDPFFENFDEDVFRKTSHLVRLGRAPIGLSSHSGDFRKPRYAPILTESIDLTRWLDPAERPATQQEAAARLDEIRKDRRIALDGLLPALREKAISDSYGPEQFFYTGNNPPRSISFTFLGLAPACAEDALFACQLGDIDRALDRLEINQHLVAAETPDLFIETLIKNSIVASTSGISEDILRTQLASEPQLQRLQAFLAKPPGYDFQRTILGELSFQRLGTQHILENRHLLSTADPTVTLFSGLGLGSTSSAWEEALTKTRDFFLQRIPSGWIKNISAENLRRNLAQIHGLDFTKQSDRRSYLERLTESADKADESYFSSPILISDFSEMWKNAFTKLQYHDTQRALMLIATELELFRLREGHYPKTLGELPSELPLDFFSGKPFRYQRKADGTPHLWSIGSDGNDDGGLPQQMNSASSKGDLVWMLTPIPSLSEDDWRRATRSH